MRKNKHTLVKGRYSNYMRIRTYRPADMPILLEIRQQAAQTDGTDSVNPAEFEAWLDSPELEAEHNVFVVTDDNDTNTWGQSETLEGLEGEIVGYTALTLYQDDQAYHFLCQGAVSPQHRRRNAGRALLICALNRARILAAEFEFEAEQEGKPIYLEALLPRCDSASSRLAARCEMQLVGEATLQGMQLYRRELYEEA